MYLLKTVLSIQTRFPRIRSADFAFLFLGSTAQLQLRPSPNALAELCGAALVLTEKFYYNKGMFWKRMYGEDDCRVFFPGKTECARAARRTGQLVVIATRPERTNCKTQFKAFSSP